MMHTQYIIDCKKVVAIKTRIPHQENISKYIFNEHRNTHPKYEVREYFNDNTNIKCILHKKSQHDCNVHDSFVSLVCDFNTPLYKVERMFPDIDFNFARNI